MNKEILTELQRGSSDEKYFLKDPITLTLCGHSICKKCIPKHDIKVIKCCISGLVTEQDFAVFTISKTTQKLLKMYLKDIFMILDTEIKLKLHEVEGK